MGNLVIHDGVKLSGSIPSGSGEPVLARNASTGTIQTQASTSGNPFSDAETLIKNSADPTKLAIFSAASIGTGTTRTFTLPNSNGTLALTTDGWLVTGTTSLVGDSTIELGTSNLTFDLGSNNEQIFSIAGNHNAGGGVVIDNTLYLTSSDYSYTCNTASAGVTYTSSFFASSGVNADAGAYAARTDGATYNHFFTVDIDTSHALLGYSDGVSNNSIELKLTETQILVTSNIVGFTGIEYAADYSADFTARSLVDKGYVDASAGWALTGTTNLTGAVTVQFGTPLVGTLYNSGEDVYLSQSVTATGATGKVHATGGNVFLQSTSASGSGTFTLDHDSGTTYQQTGAATGGIRYSADYSAGFTDRSIADWGNVWKTKGVSILQSDFQIYPTLANDNTYAIYIGSDIGESEGFPSIMATYGHSNYLIGITSAKLLWSGGNSLEMNSAGGLITLTAADTFSYAGDYSANYSTRSLVDKGYVDSVVGTSGTYTPTATNIANLDSITPDDAQWSRVGDTVTVGGTVTVNCTTATTATRFALSFPVASNLTNGYQCGGSAGTGFNEVALVSGDATNNRVEFNYVSGTDTGSHVMSYTYTYLVV